jgi:hypothetical protein
MGGAIPRLSQAVVAAVPGTRLHEMHGGGPMLGAVRPLGARKPDVG